jgi:hypothetical protein
VAGKVFERGVPEPTRSSATRDIASYLGNVLLLYRSENYDEG